ncbi:MAG: hypothetical protein R3230_00525 [Nitrosopumilaceae archaeon]|nr:hypothetical protein [Nitrosopumilaceae archaeon]
MKPIEQNSVVVSSTTNTTAFGLEENEFAYKVLSDDIYEHKIRAILRELSCNAYDSHVDAGCPDKPFRIHFPTTFHPYFEIEDYGVGLDDFDVRGKKVELFDENGDSAGHRFEGGLYTRYFASTKRDSNESIGALGLGSKSPLAYTNAMTLITIKDGVEYTYTCIMGNKGPETRYHGSTKTDKGNGVRIRFSVSDYDIEEFRKEAAFVFSTFRVKPETNVNIDYYLDEKVFDELDESGMVMIESHHNFCNHEYGLIYAEMGGVVYPVKNIDYSFLRRKHIVNEDDYNTGVDLEPMYYEFNEFAVDMLNTIIDNSRLLVKFDIGDLSFIPAREGLSQDPKTKFALYKRTIELLSKNLEELQSTLDKCRQPIEAIAEFSKYADITSKETRFYNYKGTSLFEYLYDKPLRNVGLNNLASLHIHYHDTRGHCWGAFNDAYVVRNKKPYDLHTNDIYKIYEKQDEVICFYANSDDEFKGTSKPLRFLIKNQPVDGSDRILVLREIADTKVFKRIRDVFVGKLKFYHISKLKDMVLAIDPTFYDKKVRPTTKVKVKSKTETRARCIDSNGIGFSGVIDLDDPNEKYMYVFKCNHSNSEFYINKDEDRIISENQVMNILNTTDYTKCIIMNGTNKTKVLKHVESSCYDVLNKFKDQNLDDYQRFITHITSQYTRRIHYKKSVDPLVILGDYYSFNDENSFEFICSVDENTKADIDRLKTRLDKLKDDSTYDNDYRKVYQLIVDYVDVVKHDYSLDTELTNTFKSIYENAKEKFPLLFADNESAMIEYIEMINEKYEKEVA